MKKPTLLALLLFLAVANLAHAHQKIKITGKVTNAHTSGAPLPFVAGYMNTTGFNPKYPIGTPEYTLTDNCPTLYQNPTVQTDATGKAKITFYNANDITSFQIIAKEIFYTGLVASEIRLVG